MPAGPQLDHAVINAKYSMDAAETAFAGLGFQLTERGYHTLGSINHLMILESNYVELIGLPGEEGEEQPGRPDIVDAPLGINGLVFRTEDVAATHAHLEDLGLAAAPPKSFSRPVRLADGTREAKFSTAHVASFPAAAYIFANITRRIWSGARSGSGTTTKPRRSRNSSSLPRATLLRPRPWPNCWGPR